MVLQEGQPSRHRGVLPPPAASPHPRWHSADRLTPSCARRSTWRPIGARPRARTSGRQTGACHAPVRPDSRRPCRHSSTRCGSSRCARRSVPMEHEPADCVGRLELLVNRQLRGQDPLEVDCEREHSAFVVLRRVRVQADAAPVPIESTEELPVIAVNCWRSSGSISEQATDADRDKDSRYTVCEVQLVWVCGWHTAL